MSPLARIVIPGKADLTAEDVVNLGAEKVAPPSVDTTTFSRNPVLLVR